MFSLHVFPLLLSREIVVGRKIWSALTPLPSKFPPTPFIFQIPFYFFCAWVSKEVFGILKTSPILEIW